MNKEQYIKMRNSGKYDVNWFYKYFLENGGANVSLQDFHNLFQFVQLDNVLSFLDGKFNLNSVHAPFKQGERLVNGKEHILGDFIKIVE